MMRVLFLTPAYPPFPGGGEHYARALAESLAAQGHRLTVVTSAAKKESDFWLGASPVDPHRAAPTEIEVLRCGLRPFPLRRTGLMAWRKGMVLLSALPGDQSKLLLRMARRIPPIVGIEKTLAPLPASFDLVQAFNGSWEYTMAAGWRYAKQRGLPFVAAPFMHFGVKGQDRVARNSMMDHQKRLLGDADAILALTAIEREGLIDWGLDGKRIHVIGGGIEAPPSGGNTAVAKKYNLLAPYLIFVGRGSYDKGIIHAARAVLTLRERGRRVLLAHVGQSSPEFDRFLRGLSEEERVGIRPLGILSDEEKHALIAGSQALLLPSRTDSFGLVLLEAWTHGKPVIGARAGGIPGVIDEGKNGLLVPFGDAAALAEAMALLLDDDQLRRRLGENGRLKTETVFSWSAVGEQVDSIYRQVISDER